jgi:hypothetical protein
MIASAMSGAGVAWNRHNLSPIAHKETRRLVKVRGSRCCLAPAGPGAVAAHRVVESHPADQPARPPGAVVCCPALGYNCSSSPSSLWNSCTYRSGLAAAEMRAPQGSAKPQVRLAHHNAHLTDGASALVTPGEVRFARAHLGEGVIGIVSGIDFQSDGSLDPSSGTLEPTGYCWAPPVGTP